MDRFASFIYRNSKGKEILFSINTPFWLEDINGLSGNEIKISSTQSINQIGSTVTATSVSPKNITLNGVLVSDLESSRIHLLECITPQDNGVFIYKRKGKEFFINVTPTQTPIIGNGDINQKFQCVLHCAYPYWKATKGRIEYLSGMEPMFSFPINYAIPHMFGKRIKSEFINVKNNGNAESGFKCVFTAKLQVTNPSILNVVTGEKMKINKVMQPGEKIIITTYWGNKRITSIYNDVETNAFKYRANGSTFFQLQPGDNIFKDDADENESALDTYIEFDDTFVGV